MRKDDLRDVGFAAAVCVACSLMLSVTAAALRERQEANVEIDRKRNVLKAFGVQVVDKDGNAISAERVEAYFANHITDVVIDAASGELIEGLSSGDLTSDDLKAKTRLPLYVWSDDGRTTRYAFPVSGMGLWSTLYGYLALDKDLATIIGITFYRHGETPGLGGEVDRDWFQDQFKGKRIHRDGQLLPFEVVKGLVKDKYPDGNDHAVDGISGATMTGNGINRFLNRDLANYEKYFARLRGA
jgi:Na+-transporting NADH:ubiquinone oxidoreductase subunit C